MMILIIKMNKHNNIHMYIYIHIRKLPITYYAYWLPLMPICSAIMDIRPGPRPKAQGAAGPPGPVSINMAEHICINGQQWAINEQSIYSRSYICQVTHIYIHIHLYVYLYMYIYIYIYLFCFSESNVDGEKWLGNIRSRSCDNLDGILNNVFVLGQWV